VYLHKAIVCGKIEDAVLEFTAFHPNMTKTDKHHNVKNAVMDKH